MTMIPFTVLLCLSAGKGTGLEAKGTGASSQILHPSNSHAFLWRVGARKDHDGIGPLLPLPLMHFTDDFQLYNTKFLFEETAFWTNCKTIWDIWILEDLSCFKGFWEWLIHFTIFLVVQPFLILEDWLELISPVKFLLNTENLSLKLSLLILLCWIEQWSQPVTILVELKSLIKFCLQKVLWFFQKLLHIYVLLF